LLKANKPDLVSELPSNISEKSFHLYIVSYLISFYNEDKKRFKTQGRKEGRKE
jgi:hypothetical protein